MRMDLPDKMIRWQIAPSGAGLGVGETFPDSLRLMTMPLPRLGPGEVLVEIAGCSICRRNLDTFEEGLDRRAISERTSQEAVSFPACDISGTVVDGQAEWVGREVVITSNRLRRHYGLSSHVSISVCHLLEIKDRNPFLPLAHLCTAIDALAAPVQAAVHARLTPGAKVIVLGLGGEGPFLVQAAKALGAATVAVVDGSDARLNLIREHGADWVVNARDKAIREVISELKHFREQSDQSDRGRDGWAVFWTSRCGVDSEVVTDLVSRADSFTVVRSGAVEPANRLNRLSAAHMDTIDGSGCPPETYPGLVEWATRGTIALSPYLLSRPMSWVKQALSPVHKTASDKRIVFTPDDFGLEETLEARSCR